jgi:hypothetical protein
LRRPFLTDAPLPIFQNARLEPLAHKADDALVADPMLQEPNHPFLVNLVEEAPNVGIENPVHRGIADRHRQCVQRVVLSASGPEPVREAEEVFLIDRVEQRDSRALNDFVFQRGNTEWALFVAARLRYEPSPDR